MPNHHFLTPKPRTQGVSVARCMARGSKARTIKRSGFSVLLVLTLLLGPFGQISALAATPPVKTTGANQSNQNGQTVQSLLDRANTLAAQDKFGEAIPLYERAIAKLGPNDPNVKTLNRNLQVLYVNYAVTLVNQKKYPQAEPVLQKAIKHQPGDTHAQKTLASVYFNQAMDLREAGQQNPDAQNFEQIETLVKKALALSPNEPNFKRALAANYFDNALGLAHADRLYEAAELLEGARKYESNNANINQSLLNIYLSLIQNDTEKKQQWADKALVLEPSQANQQEVQARLNPPPVDDLVGAAGTSSSSMAPESSPSGKRPKMPASASKLSLQEMMMDIESQWGIERDKKAKLAERLELAEKEINGKISDGPMATRIQSLYAQLYGQQAVAQVQDAAAPPMDLSEDALKSSYIGEVFKMTDGKVMRWSKFPIRIYIEQPDFPDDKKALEKKAVKNPETAAFHALYKPEYKQAVLDGFQRWGEASDGSVSFVEVKNERAADVIVHFDKTYVDRFADASAVPARYKEYSAPKVNNKLITAVNIASMFTPGIFSLAPMLVGSGLQYKQYKKLDLIRRESEITLGLEPTANLPQEQAVMLIQNIAAKEFGHVLGIKGLSPDSKDLMYPDLISDHARFPTQRDMATLRQIYTRPANILLNVQSQLSLY